MQKDCTPAQLQQTNITPTAGGNGQQLAGEEGDTEKLNLMAATSSPLATLVPPGYELLEYEKWAPIVRKNLINDFFGKDPKTLSALRELFADGKKAWLDVDHRKWGKIKEACGLGEGDDATFLRILSALVSIEEIRARLNHLSLEWAYYIHATCWSINGFDDDAVVEDMDYFWYFNNPDYTFSE